MTVISFYQPGERFATMTAGHVARIWRVNVNGVPVPDGARQGTDDGYHPDDGYPPDGPDGYRPPRSRPVETTPELPVAPPVADLLVPGEHWAHQEVGPSDPCRCDIDMDHGRGDE